MNRLSTRLLAAAIALSSGLAAADQGVTQPPGLPYTGGILAGPLYYHGSGTSAYDATISVTGGGSLNNRGVLGITAANTFFYGYDGTPNFQVGLTQNAAEYWEAEGGITGNGANFYATNGTSTGNVSGNFAAQNLGQFNYGNGSGQIFEIDDPGLGTNTTNWLHVTGGNGSNDPYLYSVGSNIGYNTPTNFAHKFYVNKVLSLQVDAAGTGSSLAYGHFYNNLGSSLYHIECASTTNLSTSASCYFRSSGAGAHYFANINYGTLFLISSPSSGTAGAYPNWVPATTSPTKNITLTASDGATPVQVLVPLIYSTGRTTFSNAAYTALTTDRLVSQIGTLTQSVAVTLPNANSVPAGTQIIVDDESGSVTPSFTITFTATGGNTISARSIYTPFGRRVLVSNGSNLWQDDVSIVRSPQMTWAQLQALTSPQTGDRAFVTNVGTTGTEFIYNGSAWKPPGGSFVLAHGVGSSTSPLSTISAATAGSFTISGGNPTIPAGLLSAGSYVRIQALVTKTGTTAGYTINARLGINNGTGDNTVFAVATGATTIQYDIFSEAQVITSSSYLKTNYLIPNNGQSAAAATAAVNQFSTASANYVSFDISGGNASDSYNLLSYMVEVFP